MNPAVLTLISRGMTRKNPRRARRATLASADRPMGADISMPPAVPVRRAIPERSGGAAQVPLPEVPDNATKKPIDIDKVPDNATKKPIGRPRGGVSQEARAAGVPEATYRRIQGRARIQEYPAVAEAISASPVPLSDNAVLRISRHMTEGAMLAVANAEIAIATRARPRPPSLVKTLRQEILDLKNEIARLRLLVPTNTVTVVAKQSQPPRERTQQKTAYVFQHDPKLSDEQQRQLSREIGLQQTEAAISRRIATQTE